MAKHKLDEKDIKKILAKHFKTKSSNVKFSVERKVVPAEEWYNTYSYYIVSATVSNAKD